MGGRPTVAIVSRSVPHYRVPFYEGLRSFLADRGVNLAVIYGVGSGTFDERQDQASLSWGIAVRSWGTSNRYGKLVWQAALPHVRSADLIILPQQTQFLINYPLLLRQLTGRQRVAFWGHGRNFQEWRASRAGEALKRWLSRRVHWWFAYNEMSALAVKQLGYPERRITQVQNAIDTSGLRSMFEDMDASELDKTREHFGIDAEGTGEVAIYAGGLYPDKRLDVLLAACTRIRRQLPSFELIVIGAGEDQERIEGAAASHPWIHYLGPRFGREKVALFGLSKALLMPGLVGLAVLDSFALETPLVTLADSPHSPEIEYLSHRVNGVIVDVDGASAPAEAFADAVLEVLSDDDCFDRLIQGCRQAAADYTIEAMVRSFGEGIMMALAAPGRSR